MECPAPNETHISHPSPARLRVLHKRVARGEVVDDNKEHCFPGTTAHLNIGACNNCDSMHVESRLMPHLTGGADFHLPPFQR